MSRPSRARPIALWVAAGLLFASLPLLGQGDPPPATRPAWASSRVVGSPEPPPAYRSARAFPKLGFRNPTLVERLPGAGRWFVGEQGGKLFTFRNDETVAQADVALDFARDLKSWKPDRHFHTLDGLYGLTFHPQFAQNRLCYACYTLKGDGPKPALADGCRVSRFRVTDTDPPRLDPTSETILLTWLGGGHNAGCLAFGPDGYLYVSTGDATDPNPPDGLNTGQDCSDLLSSILRIDVDRPEPGKNYAVPADNPFIGKPGVRPEIWAFGFRNPWKFSFDRETGELWAGDVGWEKWELVHRVPRGGNFGWSVNEGTQPIKPGDRVGPSPILPPTIAIPHTEAASITGGFVYRGKKYPDLVGAIVYGDWVTRTFWATRVERDGRIRDHRVIARTGERVVAFAEDDAGELLYAHYDEAGGLFRLESNPDASAARPPFPQKLSQTGLFRDTSRLVPEAGVTPFDINARQWMDGATAEYLVALPGTDPVKFNTWRKFVPGTTFEGKYWFPKDSVLAKTVSLAGTRVETQLLHFDGSAWRGYGYRWDDAGADAELVPAGGGERILNVNGRKHAYRFASRTECLTCHNPWAENTLAFNPEQLNRGGQFKALERAGVLARVPNDRPEPLTGDAPHGLARLTDPRDPSQPLEARARSYLHVNCAHCHQNGAGGSVSVEMRFDTALKDMKLIDVPPVQGAFGLPDARLVAAGDPCRSTLLYRVCKTGTGRMPHIGSEAVDEAGVGLLRDWVSSLKPGTPQLGLPFRPSPESLAKPAEALRLALVIADGPAPPEIWGREAARLAANLPAETRDLFERFLPESERVARLGASARPESVLSLTGDAGRGKAVFARDALRCAACHQVAGQGGEVGPELTRIGGQRSREQLLESLLEPSKVVEDKFRQHRLETADDKVHTGLLVSRDDKGVRMRDAQGKDIVVPVSEVEALTPLAESLMPAQLLRDLTRQEAADLVAFLMSLR